MGSTHKSTTRQMLEETREPENCRGSGRGELYSSQESFLLPLSLPLESVLSLISGVRLPSQASRPPAVMGGSTSSSGFPGFLLC